VTILGLALGVPALPAQAAYTLRCESKFNRYQYCSADTQGRVRLKDRYSRSPCDRRRGDWGYDGGGVWVANGCRASFEVGRDGGDRGNDAAKAAAIVGGLAILGAIMANSNSNDDRHRDQYVSGPDFPGWMIGSFRGYNGRFGRDETLTIDPDGRAFLTYGGRTRRGSVNGDVVMFDGRPVLMQPASGGILADSVFYRRI
jgi:hypothetical protein